MTSVLPTPLSCLTLSHIIDEPEAVEGYLSQDPSTENCFPLILRDIFFNTEVNSRWGLPRKGISDAITTLKYLRAIWLPKGTITEYGKFVVSEGLIYLLPSIIDKLPLFKVRSLFSPVDNGAWRVTVMTICSLSPEPPADKDTVSVILTQGLVDATEKGNIDAVRLLHDMGAMTSMRGYTGIRDAVGIALHREDVPMLLLLIELEPGAREVNMQRILRRAAFNNNIPMSQAVITEYPKDFSHEMYRVMETLACEENNQKFLEWLDTYARPRVYG